MAEIKFTKSELRFQQNRLLQLEKYLPTLQLKKAMLQSEVQNARQEIHQLEKGYQKLYKDVKEYSQLFSDVASVNTDQAVKIVKVNKHYENIAGVEVPYFESLEFEDYQYFLLDTPPWVDALIQGLRSLATAHAKITVAREKKAALEKELREVSIRVNLFEKILIPRAQTNIKKIKVFLGDQQLAAVSQAKVAKRKIEERKTALHIIDMSLQENLNAS